MSIVRKLVVAAVVTGFGVFVAAASSLPTEPGNSLNAKLCQKGGWQSFTDADGSPFRGEGECIAYAARGGELKAKVSLEGEGACAALGGAFSTTVVTTAQAVFLQNNSATLVWSCNGAPQPDTSELLLQACAADGGNFMSQTFGAENDFVCGRG
jgi:hypothetical protein